MYKKCTSNSYIYTENIQTAQNLHKVQTFRLKTPWNSKSRYVFYKQCTNYTKPSYITS